MQTKYFPHNINDFHLQKNVNPPNINFGNSTTIIKRLTSLEKNLAIAKETMDYVKSLNLFSTTIITRSQNVQQLFKQAMWHENDLNRLRKDKPLNEFINVTDTFCKYTKIGNNRDRGFGNCTEHAILSAVFLKEEKKIDNFGIVVAFELNNVLKYIKNPKNYIYNETHNHVFIVSGLDKNAILKNPDTWGKNAVLIDPYRGVHGQIDEAVPRIKSGFEHPENVKFTDFADFINPTNIKNSPYDWNYVKTTL